MKHSLILGILLMIGFNMYAQDKKQQEVAKTVDMLRQAILDADSAKLDQFTDSDLSYGHSVGRIENKKEFIGALVSGQSDFETMDLTDQSVVVKGSTAVVRHKLAANIKDKGNAASVKLAVLMVFHKEGKQWKLLARQAVKI